MKTLRNLLLVATTVMFTLSSMSCKKEEPKMELQSLDINPDALVLVEGEQKVLKVQIAPAELKDIEILWKSEDENVAEVNSDGQVTALAVGKTIIMATSPEYNVTARCKVTVDKKIIPAEGVKLTPEELILEENETATLIVEVLPENTTDKTVVWSSDHPEIATVEDGTVTAVKQGTAIITAEAQGQKATCTVNVKVPYVKVTSLRFKNGSQMGVWARKTGDLKSELVIEPSNATTQNAVWTSSNTDVLTIDQDGKFNAIKVGDAIVKATIKEGNDEIVASLKVAVRSDMKINGKNYGFSGENIQLTSNYAEVTWKVERVNQTEEIGTMSTIDKNGQLNLLPGSKYNPKYPNNIQPIYEDHVLKVTGTNKYGESVQTEIKNYSWKLELCYCDDESAFMVVDDKTFNFYTSDIVHVRIASNYPNITEEELSKWDFEYGSALTPVETLWPTCSNKIGPVLQIEEGGTSDDYIYNDDYRMIASLGNVSSYLTIHNLYL